MNNLVTYGHTRGDTLLVFSENHIAIVHSNIVLETCKSLAPFLTETKAAKLDSKRSSGSTLRWRVDLKHRQDKYTFVSEPVDNNGLVQEIHSTNDDTMDEKVLRTLEDVLGLWYHRPPNYGQSLRSILAKSLLLVEACKIIGPQTAVRESVEKTLLSFKEPIWPFIARNPAEFLILGYDIQSKPIFEEALIHCVGKIKLLHPIQRARLGEIEDLRLLILGKMMHMWQLKVEKEVAMLGYYPENLMSVKRDTKNMAGAAPGRGTYASQIFIWIALSLFRKWMAQMTAKGIGHRAGDGGYRLYMTMSKGGEHYLKRKECEDFYQQFPMTEKAKVIIDNVISLIKEGIKTYVEPLIARRAQYNDVEYLTSCVFDEDDYPWLYSMDKNSQSIILTFMRQFPDVGIWAPQEGTGGRSQLYAADFLKEYGADRRVEQSVAYQQGPMSSTTADGAGLTGDQEAPAPTPVPGNATSGRGRGRKRPSDAAQSSRSAKRPATQHSGS